MKEIVRNGTLVVWDDNDGTVTFERDRDTGGSTLTVNADELRWLVLVGGPAAMHEIEGAIPKVSDRANRRCANG